MEGGGGGEKRERLPASPTILENALLISRFGWFVNWQLVKIEVWLTGYPWITRIVKSLCSLIKHVPGDWKNCIPFFFFALVPTFSTNSRANACYAPSSPGLFPQKMGGAGPGDEVGLLCRLAVYVRSFFLGVELLEVGSSSGSFGIDGRANMLQLLSNLILPRCSS